MVTIVESQEWQSLVNMYNLIWLPILNKKPTHKIRCEPVQYVPAHVYED